MDASEAVAFIRDAVAQTPGTWADLGAGDGTFARALASTLGPTSTIYAVDRDRAAVDSLKRLSRDWPNVVPIHANFMVDELPELATGRLDGAFLANALHFVRDHPAAFNRIAKMLKPGGRIVVVEYDGRTPSRWVPYPVSRARLELLSIAAGLSSPRVTATRPSEYQGELYAAVMHLEDGK